SQLVTSVRWATAPPPASAATWAARASSTSAMRTCAPSRANASTIPRPMLLAPPVTMTERPARPRSTALRLSDPAPASPEKAERAHADQPDQRPQTRSATLRDQGPGAFSRWRGGSRGSRARAPHLHRVEHRVELDAEHGDQAEEIGEGHEEKDQAERLAIGVGATGEAEVEREQQRQELEEHAGHQRSGPDLAQLLAPVGYDVVNGAEEQAAGRHAEQQLEREGRRRIVQEARDEGQALHDGEEAGRDQADAGQDREEHDHRDADQDLAEEVAGPRLIDDGESRLHGVEEGRARPVGRLVGQELADQTARQALRQAPEIHDSQGINLMTGSILLRARGVEIDAMHKYATAEQFYACRLSPPEWSAGCSLAIAQRDAESVSKLCLWPAKRL